MPPGGSIALLRTATCSHASKWVYCFIKDSKPAAMPPGGSIALLRTATCSHASKWVYTRKQDDIPENFIVLRLLREIYP